MYVEVLTDPRDSMYLYDCPAGYLLITLRVLGKIKKNTYVYEGEAFLQNIAHNIFTCLYTEDSNSKQLLKINKQSKVVWNTPTKYFHPNLWIYVGICCSWVESEKGVFDWNF